ncbi:MAG: MFS transporter, partial [Oscillospiraceae bacterium]|nr:MFS transporter [Oscillospiraceae bacterium]
KNRAGEYFGFYDIFGKFSTIMGPLVCAWAMGIATDKIIKAENIAANASAEVFAEIAARSAPWGVLSILLIFFVGAGLYFFVLPHYLKKEHIHKL